MRRTGLLILLLPLLASCGVAHAVTGEKHYLITSSAMEPTLLRNARITATVVKSGEYKPVDGDIVLFDPPVDWNPDPAGGARIYRVAAIGGESIACCDAGGRIQRNGTPIDEPYVKQLAENEEFDRVEVPAGQLFLLGDNRAEAGDSTIHGLLPADTVIGVVKP